LADFGAGWLYIRYLADRYGSSITNRLEATNKVGAANVAAVTGVPFDSTATRWALSNWVAAQAGFTARPPELADTAGHLPRLFALFHNLDPTDFRLAYPLVPQTASGTGVHLAGILHGGSGWYVRVLQGPGAAAFSLLFNDSTRAVAKAVAPRLDVIRVR